tara:strand:- start:340 stop:510 length:171 start_codon:yes stop_codon:yes gene_type:complete
MTKQIYRIHTLENINGLGFEVDIGEQFDTWRKAFDRKKELQKQGKLPANNHLITIN